MKFVHCLEIGKPLETHDFPLYREKDESPAQIELSSIPWEFEVSSCPTEQYTVSSQNLKLGIAS